MRKGWRRCGGFRGLLYEPRGIGGPCGVRGALGRAGLFRAGSVDFAAPKRHVVGCHHSVRGASGFLSRGCASTGWPKAGGPLARPIITRGRGRGVVGQGRPVGGRAGDDPTTVLPDAGGTGCGERNAGLWRAASSLWWIAVLLLRVEGFLWVWVGGFVLKFPLLVGGCGGGAVRASR